MSNEEPLDDRAEAEWGDANLTALTAAILDGTPVDWDQAAAGTEDRHLGAVKQLQVLAELIALHRPAPADQKALASWGPLGIIEKIGEGAFGEIFRAWDSRLDREVALKLLRAPADSAFSATTASIEEGRLIARVRHPNVLIVYGAERIDGRTGIWTEFIEGRTLKAVLAADGPMSSETVLAIGIDLCRALAAVHDAGLLHRDIKAQNVMRETGGRIVLMDFGAGHDLGTSPASAGNMSGTPLYLAPEIFDGGPPTVASDIYALAVLLFHLLTGRYPVEGQTLDDVRAAHAADRVLRLRDVMPEMYGPRASGLSAALANAIERGLAADSLNRYESAAAFEADLSRLNAQAPVEQPRRVSGPASLILAGVAVTIAAAALMVDPGSLRSRWFGRGGLNAPPSGTSAYTTTRILNPPLTAWPGRPSRDGRYVPYIFYPEAGSTAPGGDLWYWEIATGATRQVTRSADGTAELGAWSAMSPDGSQIAYAWRTLKGVYELRVISSDGAAEPRVVLPGGAAAMPEPLEWSADGSLILCRLHRGDGTVDVSLVPVDGGAPELLRTFRRGQPRHVSLSPDGQFVVYDFPRDFESLQSQLVILETTAGAQPRVLFDEPANAMSPFWTPDGTQVFFTSDRSGYLQGWVVDVLNGVAQSEPALVARSLGLVQPVALTSDGVYHYRLDTSTLDVFSLPINEHGVAPASGKPARVPALSAGGHAGPDWSPDGRFLAYVTRVPSTSTPLNHGANKITVLDTVSGTTRDVVPRLSSTGIAPPRWSPDGLSVVVKGTSLENRRGYFRVNTTTGETTSIVYFDSASADGTYGDYRWSADGRALLFIHVPRGLVSHEVATGTETVVVDRRARALNRFFGFAESPNGASMAFVAGTGQGPTLAAVLFVQAQGGEPRELQRVGSPEWLAFQQWSSDSQDVFFTRFKQGDDSHALWKISPAGGTPEDTNIRIPAFTQFYPISLNPDRTRLAFTSGQTAMETWVMERFLPRPPGARPRR